MLERRRDRRRAATARQRRHRARTRTGKIVISVEVDADLLNLLIRTKWLSESAAADRTAIAKALAAMLTDAAR
jgi:hypothetical protein